MVKCAMPGKNVPGIRACATHTITVWQEAHVGNAAMQQTIFTIQKGM